MALLECRGVGMKFGGAAALTDVNVVAESGAITGLIGPNGAGKTTCFNLLTKFLAPSSGRILFDGLDITDSKNVRINNCFINSSDDAICLKSENPALGCENVYIENCTLRSSATADALQFINFGNRIHAVRRLSNDLMSCFNDHSTETLAP